MAINCFTGAGNLTREPELRRTSSGMAILSFGIAINERRKNNQTGEWEDAPVFLDCVMFGNRAEKLAGYLNKGSKVAVGGKLRWSSWERDGQKRSKIELVVDDLEFMSRGQGGESNRQTPQSQYSEASYFDESIPF